MRFIPVVDDKPFFIDSIYRSPGGELYEISNCKFFVSNIAFSSSLGKEESAFIENKLPILLIDFGKSNDTTKQGILSEKYSLHLQTGAYTDVRFDVGLPRQINHTDPTSAPAPLDLAQQDMYWEWNSGYIFLLIE